MNDPVYDGVLVDPLESGPELGDLEDFTRLVAVMRSRATGYRNKAEEAKGEGNKAVAAIFVAVHNELNYLAGMIAQEKLSELEAKES